MGRTLVVTGRSASGRRLTTLVGPFLGDSSVHLLVPAVRLRAGEREFVRSEFVGPGLPDEGEAAAFARWRLRDSLASLAESGIDATGEVCEANPRRAIRRMLDDRLFDQVVVAGLGSPVARRLRVDRISRLARRAGIPVLDTAAVAEVQPGPGHEAA